MNIFSRALVWCAGASPQTMSTCPEHERLRYEGIGATVILTGVFAAISGGYAIERIMYSRGAAVALGVLWGVMIFNIDRVFVSGFRRHRGEPFVAPLARALPRVILASALALVISKPLEVRVAGERLNQPLLEIRNAGLAATRGGLRNAHDAAAIQQRTDLARRQIDNLAIKRDQPPNTRGYARLVSDHERCDAEAIALRRGHEGRIGDLQREIAPLRTNVKALGRELGGLATQLAVEGSATAANDLRARIRTISSEQRRLNDVIGERNREIRSLRDEIDRKNAACKAIEQQIVSEEAQYRRGISDQMARWSTELSQQEQARREAEAAITRVGADDQTKLLRAYEGNFIAELEALALLERTNATVRWTGRLLWFIFALIECAPIIVKFLTPSGPYDAALDAADRRFYSVVSGRY